MLCISSRVLLASIRVSRITRLLGLVRIHFCSVAKVLMCGLIVSLMTFRKCHQTARICKIRGEGNAFTAGAAHCLVYAYVIVSKEPTRIARIRGRLGHIASPSRWPHAEWATRACACWCSWSEWCDPQGGTGIVMQLPATASGWRAEQIQYEATRPRKVAYLVPQPIIAFNAADKMYDCKLVGRCVRSSKSPSSFSIVPSRLQP